MSVEDLFDIRPERPGYRLQRLELVNWGTFDSTSGQIYRFEPDGRTALLVGNNGSGKSTVVDAILTLLVPSHIRNYNVAAGAKKTERNEKSYIRGAYGRSTDESLTTLVQYLRPKGNPLSALLAVFRDEQLNRAFTICQILHLTGDGSVDKVYALAEEAHELKEDLAALSHSDSVRVQLQKLGYQTTKTFTEYEAWIVQRTGMRGKAMDMLNQTVAVKDIQSLNDFIRRHMLEAHDWREKVQRLLTHFSDLTLAHQELVRTRMAVELLEPIEKLGHRYREQSQQLDELERRLGAAETFFAAEAVRLGEPAVAIRRADLAATLAVKERLTRELAVGQETIRQLKNEIDSAGGERVRALPGLIQQEQAVLERKRQWSEHYHQQLRRCGIDTPIDREKAFTATRKRLQSLLQEARAERETAVRQQEEIAARRGLAHQQLRRDTEELERLRQRPSNLPSHLATLRSRMCDALGVPESALPFAAELMSVLPEERHWEGSVEMVLRPLALSLLVPAPLHPRVQQYVERTKIANERGEGQRLVYLRVGRTAAGPPAGDRRHPQSILRKLQFRTDHELASWVEQEIQRRLDFRCCDTLEQLNQVDRLGMTANRHIKIGQDRHEKDDRPRAVDPRHYVLGWDNGEKRRAIAEHVQARQGELAELDREFANHSAGLHRLQERLAAAAAALEVIDFDTIDTRKHEGTIASYRREQEALERTNQPVRTLRKSLEKAEQSVADLTGSRDEALKREQSLSDAIARDSLLIEQARQVLVETHRAGTYPAHEREFPAISESLPVKQLSIDNLFSCQTQWPEETRRTADRLRKTLQPAAEKLVEAMSRFLREFKEEQSDLDASVHSLDSFLQLLHQVRHEDLPRFERKFKDRLNEKVRQEVALLQGSLRQECKQIEAKIAQLNTALASLEYQPGTFMRLEPREVHDRDVTEFRRALRECLDESLEQHDEANEARFLRIQKLVQRLADKENTRWRDKVIDVRYWFDFAAREIQSEDGATRSFYEDSTGQSGGEKAKLAFTILVAAIAYQYDLDPAGKTPGRFHFVVVDEMFSKVDDQNAEYALRLFQQFGLQLLIVAPLDAKARVTESYVDCYLHAVKDEQTHCSQLYSMTAREYDEVIHSFPGDGNGARLRPRRAAK